LETAQWFPRGQLPEDIAPYVGEIVAHIPAL
jgi:hypothetical protein